MPDTDITTLLAAWTRGDVGARDRLMEELYPRLRKLAGHLRNQRRGCALQTTELVHEAYLHLVDQQEVRWQNRAHFVAIAGRVLRRLLVDQWRRAHRHKRGGDAEHQSLTDVVVYVEGQNLDVLALDRALSELEALDAEAAKVVELRYFAGLDHDETAAALGMGRATVGRRWRFARAWLRARLADQPIPAPSGAERGRDR